MKKRMLLYFSLLVPLTGCFDNSPENKFKFTIASRDKDNVEMISDAAEQLLEYCPAVKSSIVTETNASFTTIVMPYRADALGWKDEVYFQIAESKSGNTHHIYVNTGDINPGIVVVKQPTLDFCNIPYQRNGEDPYCRIGETGVIGCRSVLSFQ